MSVINEKNIMRVVIHNFCSNCGTKISEDSKFCLNCGTVISSNEDNVKNYIMKRNEQNLEKLKFILLATAFIWMSVIFTSLFSPDLISGSNQEHLPLVLWTAWFWGLIANMFLFRLLKEQNDFSILKLQIGSVIILWTIVAMIGIFTPPFVTGSDPTSLPIASIVAPLIACILTAGIWFLGKPSNNY